MANASKFSSEVEPIVQNLPSQVHVCEFCEKQYSTEKSLKSHQSTSVDCRKRRGLEIPKFECPNCGGTMSKLKSWNEHQKNCKPVELLPNEIFRPIEVCNGVYKDYRIRLKKHRRLSSFGGLRFAKVLFQTFNS